VNVTRYICVVISIFGSLRGACAFAIGFSPFIGNTRAMAGGLDKKIKIAEEEEFAVGCVSYSTDSPVGGGGFTTCYSVGASSGPEDDNFQPFIPPFPGQVYTTMNDGDCSYRLDPAGSSPGTGTCPSVTVHLGPGAVVDVPAGAMWHTTASADFTGTKGTVWKATITDAYGSISPGRYVGPTSFSFGGTAPSISYTA
jgi:hypothetical protein